MSTLDSVLLIIITSLLSLLFLVWIFLAVVLIKLVIAVKKTVTKAEEVLDSVETAAEVLKDTGGKFAFFKFIRNIIKLVNGRTK
jgi:hypothetical protein